MAFNDETSRLEIGRVIELRLATGWTSGSLYRTAIQFPSVLGLVGTDTSSISSEPPTGADWIRLDIIDDDAEAFCYGGTSGQNRCFGLIQITLFTPKQAGDKQLFTLGGLLKPIFNRYHADGLQCNASSLRKIDSEKGWNRVIVTTPFQYFEEVTT
jgi:hypothetical protein